MGVPAVTICVVRTNQHMADFIKVPHTIYKEDPLWVAPLTLERKEHFSKKNPFFDHAKCQFFVAYGEGNTPIGRISAQIDHQEKQSSTIGHFGCLEATTPAVLNVLLKEAEKWLIAQGIQEVTGPYSLSINDEVGLLIEGEPTPPKLVMNYAPSWYASALKKAGYTKEKDLLAYLFNLADELPKIVTLSAERTQRKLNLTERPIRLQALEEDLTTIMNIFNDAWANNWGFTPMTKGEISYMAKNIRPILNPQMARISFVEGKPMAMIIALPDANEALHPLKGKLFPFGWLKLLWRLKVKKLTRARLLLMGVRQEYQKGHLGGAIVMLLIKNMHTIARNAGLKEIELSWILEDNTPMRHILEKIGAKHTKTYRVYKKTLTSTSK